MSTSGGIIPFPQQVLEVPRAEHGVEVLQHECQRDDFAYVCVDGQWHLITWGPKKQTRINAQQTTTEWLVQARPARAAHCCGRLLWDKTQMVPYTTGENAQIDAAIVALRRKVVVGHGG